MSESPRFHPGRHEKTSTTLANSETRNGIERIIENTKISAKEMKTKYREPTEVEVRAFHSVEKVVDELVREYTGLDADPFDDKMFQVLSSDGASSPHFDALGFVRVNERELDNPLGMLDFIHDICHEVTHAKSRFQLVIGEGVVSRSGLNVQKKYVEKSSVKPTHINLFEALNEGITSYIEIMAYARVALRTPELNSALENFWSANSLALEEKFDMKSSYELLSLSSLSGKNKSDGVSHSYPLERAFVQMTLEEITRVEPDLSKKDAERVFMDAYFLGESTQLKRLFKKIYGKDALRFAALWRTDDIYDNTYRRLILDIFHPGSADDRVEAVSKFVAHVDANRNHCNFCGKPGQKGRKTCSNCQIKPLPLS